MSGLVSGTVDGGCHRLASLGKEFEHGVDTGKSSSVCLLLVLLSLDVTRDDLLPSLEVRSLAGLALPLPHKFPLSQNLDRLRPGSPSAPQCLAAPSHLSF